MTTIGHVLKSKGSAIWSVDSKSRVYDALEFMAEKDIGALLVIDDGKMVGIFTERDYARKVILKGKSSKATLVDELMTRKVYSISPDKSVEECMAVMTTAKCRHMPVIEDDKLTGIVTFGDIASAIASADKREIEDLKKYIVGNDYIRDAQ